MELYKMVTHFGDRHLGNIDTSRLLDIQDCEFTISIFGRPVGILVDVRKILEESVDECC